MKWKICTSDEPRFVRNKKANNNRGAYEKINVFINDEQVKKDAGIKEELEKISGNVNEQMKYLFKEIAKLNYEKTPDIKAELQAKDLNHEFFDKLLRLFSATLNLRQNNGMKDDREEDKILSPIIQKDGKEIKTSANKILPDNADANGAYHIALKGLLLLKRIRGDKDVEKFDKKGNVDFSISNKEWLEFAQKVAQKNK